MWFRLSTVLAAFLYSLYPFAPPIRISIHVNLIKLCKIKIKHISQTQLCSKKNITLYSYMFWFVLNHHHAFIQKFLKLSSSLNSFAVYLISFSAESFVFHFVIQNIYIKIHRTIIVPLVLYGCETCFSYWRTNIRWGYSRTGCWGRYLGLKETR